MIIPQFMADNFVLSHFGITKRRRRPTKRDGSIKEPITQSIRIKTPKPTPEENKNKRLKAKNDKRTRHKIKAISQVD